jgi:threonylcarbamoyladenosine tRNA methylthiotransferase MtaB
MNPDGIVAVVGCYARLKPEEVADIGADIVLGNEDEGRLPELIIEAVETMASRSLSVSEGTEACDGNEPGARRGVGTEATYALGKSKPEFLDGAGTARAMGSRTRAMIKVEDGCDKYCAFCVIPYVRGSVRSVDADTVLDEARRLVAAGCKEIVLTGINMALYGSDFRDPDSSSLRKAEKRIACGAVSLNRKTLGNGDIDYLIGRINDIKGDFRIRMGSLEPTVIDAAYASRLLRFEKLCPALHLPLQSGSDRVLKAMGRAYTRESYMEMVEALRNLNPHFGISTDVIVGFPGETCEDFADSLSLVDKAAFLHVHVFPFSIREGTKAADMGGQIAPEMKSRRRDALIAAGEVSASCFIDRNLGKERVVLPEAVDNGTGLLEGLTDNGLRVFFKGSEELIGGFVKVRLCSYMDGRIGGVPV